MLVAAALRLLPCMLRHLVRHCICMQAVLGLSESCSLPRNAPGVYLLLRPHDINKDKGSNSPWPVDDYFVPGKLHCNADLDLCHVAALHGVQNVLLLYWALLEKHGLVP